MNLACDWWALVRARVRVRVGVRDRVRVRVGVRFRDAVTDTVRNRANMVRVR